MEAPYADSFAEELQLLASSARDFCARALDIRRLRALSDEQHSFDRSVWSDMTELGWTEILVPARAGGLGYGAAAISRVARELGRVLAREPFIETALAAAVLSAAENYDAQLAILRGGEVVYTAPFNPADWSVCNYVKARRDGDGFILDGALTGLAVIDQADRVLVPARLDDAVTVFDLAKDANGLDIRTHCLADGSFAGDLSLRHVRLAPEDHIVCAANLNDALANALAVAGIAASAYLLGLSEALLDRTLEYVRTRRQFGTAIGSFQALQHRLVDVYLQNRLSAAAVQAAVVAHDNGDAVIAAACARQRACETAMMSVREAIQMHGAIGYTAESDVALYVWRMLVMVARFGGGIDQLKNDEKFVRLAFSQTELGAPAAAPNPVAPPSSDNWNSLSDEAFRLAVRAWFVANYPEHLRHLSYQVRWSEISDWHYCLVEQGWAAPGWPREHGGMGLSPSKLLIFIEELERHGVARAPDQGIVMLGPILFKYGSDEQRARFLHKALTGEHIWCQGYSEPNAGSDLASLTTRAATDGDEFVVTGQKTWTTHALDATHMYCLVRTDTQVKPQAGISFLLIELDQPGVEIRPIPNLGGHVDFCEVFLDEVRVPISNLVGELNQGWTIAKALLGHERLFVGSPKLCQYALNQLRVLAERRDLSNDPVFVEAMVKATLDVLDLEALYAEFAELAKDGKEFGADVALLKIWSTETYVALSELIFKCSGAAAAIPGGPADTGVDAIGHYYNARPAPIYAGSNEIQRNILAKHVLELPT